MIARSSLMRPIARRSPEEGALFPSIESEMLYNGQRSTAPMPHSENRKRNQPGFFRSLRQRLFSRRRVSDGDEEVLRESMFPHPDDEDEEAVARIRPRRGLLSGLWFRFNVLSTVALLLFLGFTALLYYILLQLWIPRDMSTIPGYRDQTPTADLREKLRRAEGTEVSFTEEEVNRYLSQTCRVRQTGIFSLLAHAEGVAFVFHDGYAEIIVDRSLSANLHQTSSLDLHFTRETEHGLPVLKTHFNGKVPLTNKVPRGGQIGAADVPERCVQMLRYALDSLLACYPDIIGMIQENNYLPVFTPGRVTLVPLTPDNNTP